MNIEEWVAFSDEHIMTKKEVQELLGMSDVALSQSLATKRLVPIFERGEGRSMVRLFYRPHVEVYKKQVEERRMRLRNSKKE